MNRKDKTVNEHDADDHILHKISSVAALNEISSNVCTWVVNYRWNLVVASFFIRIPPFIQSIIVLVYGFMCLCMVEGGNKGQRA